MAPDQRGEMGDVVVVDIHALLPDVANGLLHVDGVDDGIEGEAQGAKLLFLPLLKRASDLPAFAMVDAPAEMPEFQRADEADHTASFPDSSCGTLRITNQNSVIENISFSGALIKCMSTP